MKQKYAHTQQRDQSDCGVACLLTVVHYFEGRTTLEHLRHISGTGPQGTNLLGLYQGAQKLGMEAQGYQAELANLKELDAPAILHVIKNQRFEHFIVCYGYDDQLAKFIVSDPIDDRISQVAPSDLAAMWSSKRMLVLRKGQLKTAPKQGKNNQFLWLKNLVQADFDILGMALALGIFIAILGLSTAIFSQKLIDEILPQKDSTSLYLGIGFLLILLLAKACLSYVRSLFLARQSKDFNTRLINHFYGMLLFLPRAFFDSRKTGDLVARMNDGQRIQRTISYLVSESAIHLLMIIVATATIFIYNTTIGVIALLWLPVFGIVVYRFHPSIIRGQGQVMKAHALNESHYIDTIQGFRVIQINNKQGLFNRLTKNVYSFFQQTIFDLNKIAISYNLITELLGSIFIVGIILGSSILVISGSISLGVVAALIQMIGMLIGSASQLALANLQLQEAKIAFNRMYEFSSVEKEFTPATEQEQETISHFEQLSIENLSFNFPGQQPILDDMSLSLDRGQWLAIFGESGSGKSTLLQLIQKCYPWQDGEILVNDKDLRTIRFHDWRSLLGVVPQEIKLFNGNLIYNIILEETVEDPEQVKAFLRSYGFDRFFERFPNGYNTMLGEGGIKISGGQKQLVGLARALYNQPQFLLLDEPTAALDREAELFVLELLQRLKDQVSIILLTHSIRVAKAADKICILKEGKIAHTGHHQDLVHLSDNLYAHAWYDLVMAP